MSNKKFQKAVIILMAVIMVVSTVAFGLTMLL
ncbi:MULTISPECIES: stressosome-associated protein Prli42 [Kurthia]|uniref:Stressosome-associated protein Prli42 n=1 Tax=Kurthia populi TaxID=1562132 RepID=A0ABW5Y609_9BACL|nr:MULTISPECIES: stressosome-associated protein Prli42 [unclassified Kurthia]HIX44571.1 stressosome-associated protein Prli42 [Candidatus Kurthia intestinigallinarum]